MDEQGRGRSKTRTVDGIKSSKVEAIACTFCVLLNYGRGRWIECTGSSGNRSWRGDILRIITASISNPTRPRVMNSDSIRRKVKIGRFGLGDVGQHIWLIIIHLLGLAPEGWLAAPDTRA
jgi:hypothetical protein